MMVEVEIEFDAIGGAHQAESDLCSAVAATRKVFAGEQRRLVAEAMLMVTQTINAGVDYELAG